MKKIAKRAFRILAIVLLISQLVFSALNVEEVQAAIRISSRAATLEVGKIKTLKVYGTKQKVTWYSSKKSVATVSSNGKVTAKAAGTATITASVSDKKLTSKVTVKEPISNEVTTTNLPSASSKKVVGYYAAWAKYTDFTPDKINAGKLTHINYAFANIGSDFKLLLGYPDIDDANIKQLNQLKESNPNLKTLIAVGGWSWSSRFSDVALTQESREIFADSCIEFILKYGFDGVDIDWEYPVTGGSLTNIRRPEDKENFTLLMKTLREKLDARGTIDKKHYILSFAGAAGNWYLNNIELAKLNQYIDYANIMTYDIHGTWEQTTDFNAPLYVDSLTADAGYRTSVDTSITSWLNAGFPKEKLIMGVPFYGHIYKAAGAENNGLYQTYSGGASINYANIVSNYLINPSFVRYFHAEALVPWLFDGSIFISYEDEQSIEMKVKYMKEKGLGGAMIWELSQDPNHVLLDFLTRELNR